MKTEEISVSQIKRSLSRLPFEKLPEVNDFIESALVEPRKRCSERTEKLEGLWEGIGFERISDIDKCIRDIRGLSEKALAYRISKWNI